MIVFSSEAFTNSICIGRIYKFTSKDDDNHPHFLIAKDNEDNYIFLKGTSQERTIEKRILYHGLNRQYVICIDPAQDNGLKKRTFIDCTAFCLINKNVLIAKNNAGLLEFKGLINDSDILNIWQGFFAEDNPKVYKNIIKKYLDIFEHKGKICLNFS